MPISIHRSALVVLLLLAGCAAHRPPVCKGPYTPIQLAAEVPHGA